MISSWEQPLRKFKDVLDTEWGCLVRDLAIALQDDTQMFKTFVDRVRRRLEYDWKQKIELLRDNLRHKAE